MMENSRIRCRIHCQKGKEISAELLADKENKSVYDAEGVHIEMAENTAGGCQCGEFRLHMKKESCWENRNLRMEKPIRVYLPVKERPEKITAMYLFNEWWTRPAFVEKFQDIPEFTQIAFLKYRDRFVCFLPMVGKEFKTYMVSGTETEICLEMTAYLGGQREVDEPLYLLAEADTLTEAVHKAFTWLAEYKGIRMRENRRIPEMLTYLGWCSWDACYKEVSEDIIRRKAEEFAEKNVPVRWLLIDDGWLSAQDEMLCDFAPDKTKFPDGFRHMTREIRENGKIRWFGVWHALGGYWGGVLPGSGLDTGENPYLYRTLDGKVLPSPQTGEGFYRDWYEQLRRGGIDFVKVDGQSAMPFYFEDNLPVSQTARGMDRALESGAVCMDGAIINCMGMAMESILARPTSAVSRNSDDFLPGKENGFAEHLLQNAYNAVYHNELYYCDWDMFWTKHEDCVKHGLLRAISGGPVYCSDEVGATDPRALKPLTYTDGRILMMDRSAKPTEDCIFSDPMESGVLKLHNTARWGGNGKGGGIAVYNLAKEVQKFSFTPSDIPDLEAADEYWVYDFFAERAFSLSRSGYYEGTLKQDGFAWFVVLPKGKNGACLGLLDKYAGFTAVESVQERDGTQTVIVRESGTIGWISDREPEQVLVNIADVTEKVQKRDRLYEVKLPESPHKTVLSIVW